MRPEPPRLDKKPDWAREKSLPSHCVWEFVALTRNLDPREIDYERYSDWAIWTDKRGELGERLDVLMRVVTDKDCPFEIIEPHHNAALIRVRLPSFVKWAIEQTKWKIPPKLKALATEARAVPTTINEVAPDAIPDAAATDIQQAYDSLRAKDGKAPSMRAVAAESGYDRATVRKRWHLLKTSQNQPP